MSAVTFEAGTQLLLRCPRVKRQDMFRSTVMSDIDLGFADQAGLGNVVQGGVGSATHEWKERQENPAVAMKQVLRKPKLHDV